MPEQYCVGPSMATDWGDEKPEISRRLLGRVFSYFLQVSLKHAHEELLDRGGLYKTLYDRQFRTAARAKDKLELVRV